jgi:uncharacterized protein YggE
MHETVITVQGKFSVFYPAERATVSVAVHHQGEVRQAAFTATVAAAGVVRESITRLHDRQAGPVTWWSSDSVQVWTEQPWAADGKKAATAFHSRVKFSAKFSDFAVMARWIEQVAAVDGSTVASVAWALTAARTTGATTEVRSRAVQDAVMKATVYAQSLGLRSVRAIAVADPGMLGDQIRGEAVHETMSYARASAAVTTDEPSLALEPEDIEVAAVIDARFVAS